MKTKLIKSFFLAFTLLACNEAFAESTMVESFHANGSIRVVVAVAVIVMSGLLFFLIRLERRVKKLEHKRQSGI